MPKYDELQASAFRLRPDGLQRLNGNFWTLTFPRTWIDPILDLLQSTDARRKSVPIAPLNRAMRALVPDVTAVDRGVGNRKHSGDWLYSTSPIPVNGLFPILHAWLRTVVDPKHTDQAAQLWAALPKKELDWRQVRAAEIGWLNGHDIAADTPAATERIASLPRSVLTLVPETLTAELLRRADRPAEFPVGFRRCPTQDGRGVEMISWPPLEANDRQGRRWPYSYRVRLTVQTVPYQPEPVLHASIGLRRWCPRPPFTGKRSVNVYLLSKLPWISGLPRSRSFRVAPMRWRRSADRRGLGWHKELHYLFDNIPFDNITIDPAKLADDPLAYIGTGDPDVGAAIVYGTRAGYDHYVGAGVPARDRERIRTWIEHTLADLMEPLAGLQPVPITLPAIEPPSTKEIRDRLWKATGGRPLTVEIHWDTEPVRDAVTHAVIHDLGLEPDGGTPSDSGTVWSADPLLVTIRQQKIGALASPLEVDDSIRDVQMRKRRAARPRKDEVVATLGTTQDTVAFVELRNRDAFSATPGTDPKAALRIGFAESGRLTQFITPSATPTGGKKRQQANDEPGDRAASSWRDLRRQLAGSVRPVRAEVNKLALPHPVDSMAVYMLRRNATDHTWARRHQLPVAVWTSSDSADVWARTIGCREWLPYPDLLRELATGRAFKLPELSTRQLCGFVRDEVITSARPDRPTLLLTWTQNLRLDWEDLQNSKAVIDRLAIDGTEINDLAPQIRHVMVRTRDGDETPEVYGQNEERIGLPSGLFRYPNSSRVFGSIAQKPGSAKNHASPMGTRADHIVDDDGRLMLDTKRPTFNPQFLQLTVAVLPDGDDPTIWAAMAHAQRRLSDTYTATLRLPWPLHLAMKATEYAIPDLEDDADEDSGADDSASLDEESDEP
ncbi:pPIWI_RE module domain-containing protein [Gandjariella thermophila]|uniref:DUF3893 domain-containing protein n=1 Tax=Gandjariella thermophila TaxID=1931992 RepID=A0A4D4JF58_9PSEU|nr:DUF3962 domain-containing protein [Gandjariella thermophila]GDY33650.1 hypothetical protein GTS_52830 [Gandjariella thermophila]